MRGAHWLVKLFAGILILLGIAFVGLQLAVSQGTEVLIGSVQKRLRSAGIQADLSVGRAGFTLPCTVIWSRVVGNAILEPEGPFGSRLAGGTISVEEVRIRPMNFKLDRWSVEMIRITITADLRPAANPDPSKPVSQSGSQTLFFRRLSTPVRMNALNPGGLKQDLASLGEEVDRWVASGKTPIDMQFEGKFLMSIGGQRGELNFKSIRKDGSTSLELDRAEVKRIGDLTEEGLTDAEVTVLMSHPAKAPKLLEIQRYASDTARKLRKATHGFPSDAYRHVLWSYLLTKEYGSEFALLLTDSHETGENKTADDPRDHAMDLNNNRVGIGYALMGLDESEIQWKVVSDPRIVRSRESVVL